MKLDILVVNQYKHQVKERELTKLMREQLLKCDEITFKNGFYEGENCMQCAYNYQESGNCGDFFEIAEGSDLCDSCLRYIDLRNKRKAQRSEIGKYKRKISTWAKRNIFND